VGYVFIARSVTRRTLMFFLTRRFCVCFYSVETSVLYNVCETFVKIRMKFSPRKVVFLLSLFQTFTAKKKLCAVFPSGSVWHSFTKFPKQLLCWNTGILHTSLTVAFVALSSGDWPHRILEFTVFKFITSRPVTTPYAHKTQT